MGIFTEKEIELYKNKMEYPQEFIDKCLKLYPDNEEVKELLDMKSFLLGSYIKNSIPAAITYEDIVEANKKCDFTEVARKNKERMDKSELLSKFLELYDEQYHSKGKCIKNGKVYFSLLREYKAPIKCEILPPEKGPSKRLIAALDYNESCRAAGLKAAENYIAGGAID